jgi:ribosome modulation factor
MVVDKRCARRRNARARVLRLCALHAVVMPMKTRKELHKSEIKRAFDRGVREGEAGQPESSNPYHFQTLRDAWAVGHSVGVFNKRK